MVNVVSDHAARVISLLNPEMRLSCKVKNADYFGSLVWNGESPYYAVLEELPRHVVYHRGDTIITSGYSTVFPEGLIVGTIDGAAINKASDFVSLRIKLSTDFTRLSTVRAIKSKISAEVQQLEATNKDDSE